MSPKEFHEKMLAPRRVRFTRLLGARPLPRGPKAGKRIDRCVVNALLAKDEAAQMAMCGFLQSLYRALIFGMDPGLTIYNTREDLTFFLDRAFSILGQAPSGGFLGPIESIMFALSGTEHIPEGFGSSWGYREMRYYKWAQLYISCDKASKRPGSFWAGVCRAYLALPHSRQETKA
jgi:hypothetical protein